MTIQRYTFHWDWMPTERIRFNKCCTLLAVSFHHPLSWLAISCRFSMSLSEETALSYQLCTTRLHANTPSLWAVSSELSCGINLSLMAVATTDDHVKKAIYNTDIPYTYSALRTISILYGAAGLRFHLYPKWSIIWMVCLTTSAKWTTNIT